MRKNNYCLDCKKEIDKRSKRCKSCCCRGNRSYKFGTHLTKKTKQLIKQKALEQFKNGMPEATKRKLVKASKRRVFLSLGNTFTNRGYIWVKIGKKKYISQQRFVAGKYIGRKLKKTELVHHIDGNGLNNKINNLYIFTKKEVHFSFEILIKNKYLKRTFLKSNLNDFKINNGEKK
jgi:hypothetical protein